MFLIIFFHAEAGIVRHLFVDFEQKWTWCSYKIVFTKNYF